MDENLIGQVSALRDEIDRINAQLRPGNYNRVSPQKEKGDLAVWSNKKAKRLPIGKNNQVLVVDPRAEGGMKWADASSVAGGQLLVPFLTEGSADAAWGGMPLAETFFMGDHRTVTLADLTNFTEFRLVVNRQGTAGTTDSILYAQYKTTFSTTASDYSNLGTTVGSVSCNGTNTVVNSGWIPIATDARADVYLALMGSGGDGILSPTFGMTCLQFR